MDIGTAITSAKVAIDAGKVILKAGHEMDMAAMKLEYGKLVDELRDAKDALYEAEREIRSKDDEIAILKAELDRRGQFEEHKGFKYAVDTFGNRVETPYCRHCDEAERKLITLNGRGDQGSGTCPHCETSVIFDQEAYSAWHRGMSDRIRGPKW